MRALPHAVLALVALAACNAISGAGDLSVAADGACATCDGGASSGGSSGGSSGSSGKTSSGGTSSGGTSSGENPGPVGQQLDPAFGTGGVVESPLLTDASAVVVLPGGAIVVVGAFGGGIGAVKLSPTGAVDPSFGTAGRAVGASDNARPAAAVVDAAGRVTVAGWADAPGGIHVGTLVRFVGAGLDPSYGANGVSTASTVPSEGRGIAARGTGSVVVGLSGSTPYTAAGVADDGSLDTSFGAGGQIAWNLPGSNGVMAGVVALPGGGYAAAASGSGSVSVVAFGPNGAPTAGFGNAGTAQVPLGSSAVARAIGATAAGDVVVAGEIDKPGTRTPVAAVARLDDSGKTLSGWGNNGRVTFGLDQFFPVTSADDHVTAVAVDGGGRVLVVGWTHEKGFAGEQTRGVVARISTMGQLDFTFGATGKVSIEHASKTLQLTAAALQPDGKLVVAGHSLNGLYVARVVP